MFICFICVISSLIILQISESNLVVLKFDCLDLHQMHSFGMLTNQWLWIHFQLSYFAKYNFWKSKYQYIDFFIINKRKIYLNIFVVYRWYNTRQYSKKYYFLNIYSLWARICKSIIAQWIQSLPNIIYSISINQCIQKYFYKRWKLLSHFSHTR